MAEAAFVIEGKEYPIPGLESFNMDEAMTLYESCGLTLEDFAVDEDDPEQVEELESKTRHPGFVRALMIVAYQRGNPGVQKRKAEALIGGSNLFDALKSFFGSVEEDPTEPQKSDSATESSPASLASNGGSSGSDSSTSSAPAVETPGPTGTSA